MRKIQNVQRTWLRKLSKLYIWAFAIFLGVYFVFAFFDPGLLSYDMRQKFRALADDTITITATVLGVPVEPVVTGSASCDGTTGELSVALNWADDANSYTYDVERDSLPLVSGLGNSAYSDTTVVVNTSYSYTVTARGPMGPGFATSIPIVVTTPDVCAVTAISPTVTIVSFAGRNIDSYDGTPHAENRRPLFTGTTNIPDAEILVTIEESFIAQFDANSNGYWEWKPPFGVSSGGHIFTVTATDPSGGTRQATASLRFDIRKRDDQGSSQKTEETDFLKMSPDRGQVISPLDFTLALEEENDSVLQGEMLHAVITIEKLQQRYTHIEVPIRYSVIDNNGELVFSETRRSFITQGEVIREAFSIPLYTMIGKYSLRAELFLDTLNISRSTPFVVRELPLIRLSSGGSVSYADIVRNLGWAIFSLFSGIFSWFSLLGREFVFFLKGDGAIVARQLSKAGFIRK